MGHPASTGRVLRFGLFEADVARNTLTRKGVRIKIQDQPFRVLTLLLERPGEITTREELRQQLWPEGTYVDFEGSLNAILKKLRAALDDDSDNPRFIETVPRRGYRFIAPVSVDNATSGAHASADATVERIPEIEAPTSEALSKPGRPLRPVLYGALAVVLLIAIGGTWLRWHTTRSRATSPVSTSQTIAPVPVRRSVAVLGFHNLSGKVDEGWLATAFSEMLSTELSAGEKLRLVSGEDVANLRLSSPWSETDTLGQQTTARIGAALNSDVLVLGSYASVGKPERRQLRIDVRLQDAKTGQILAEVAEIGSSDNFFQLISQIGSKLRDRLGVLGVAETDESGVVASMPSNSEAARFYALGLVKLREFDDSAARDLFQQAIKADPKFPLSHLMLARAWSQLGYEQNRRSEAKKALDLADGLSRTEKMLLEGNYYESLADYGNAASSYRALFELFPDNVEFGLLLAAAQNSAGHVNQSLETIARLRQLPQGSEDPRIDLAESAATVNKPAAQALLLAAERKAKLQGQKLAYARARAEECKLVGPDHPDQAQPSCDEAYGILWATGDRVRAADIIRLKGDLQLAQGQREQALTTYQRALAIMEKLGDHEETGVILSAMANDVTNQGKFDRGEQLYRESKSQFEQAGDRARVAVAILHLGNFSYLRGDLRAASKLYHQSLEIQTSLDHPNLGEVLARLSDVELLLGHASDAHQYAQRAVEAFRPVQGDYEHLAKAMTNLGEALEAEGDLQGARQQFQAVLEMEQKVGNVIIVAESEEELADVAMEENRADQAEPLLRTAIAEFEKDQEILTWLAPMPSSAEPC